MNTTTFRNRLMAGIAGSFIAGMVIIGAATPANASVLVESIVDSSKTDNPQRFCWVLQTIDPDDGSVHGEVSINNHQDANILDSFKSGTLTFGDGANFPSETNIDAPHKANEDFYRLHRVACPPEDASAIDPGHDEEEEHEIEQNRSAEEQQHSSSSLGLPDLSIAVGVFGSFGDRHGGRDRDSGERHVSQPHGDSDTKRSVDGGDKSSDGKSIAGKGLDLFSGHGLSF
jgi:hypothetical protein